MTRRQWMPMLFVLLGASSFGFLSSLVKLSFGAGFAETDITVNQITMGAALIWIVFLLQPKAWANPFRGPWISLSLIGIFGLALTTVLYNTALAELDASLAIILLFQFTWITMVLDAVKSRKWPRGGRLLALVLIMAGTAFAVNVFAIDWTRFTVRGLLFGLGSAVTYSLFLFTSGQVQTTWSPLLKSVIMLTAGVPAIWLFYSFPNWSQPDAGSLVLWGCILGLFGQVLPNVFFMIGIPRIGSSLAAILGAMELPVAIVSAFVILRENVTVVQWVGIVLILLGVAVTELKTGAKRENAG